MIRQCCQCLVVYGVKPLLDDHRVTHGLCDRCFKLALQTAGVRLPEEMPQDCYSGE